MNTKALISCVSDLVRIPDCWFSHEAALLSYRTTVETYLKDDPEGNTGSLAKVSADELATKLKDKMTNISGLQTGLEKLRQYLKVWWLCSDPYLMNGFSHYYQLDESTFIFRGIRSEFQFSYKFLIKVLLANRIATDGTPRSATSHLWLYCLPLPVSHKQDARLK